MNLEIFLQRKKLIDHYIKTSRKNPYNPNYQTSNWLGGNDPLRDMQTFNQQQALAILSQAGHMGQNQSMVVQPQTNQINPSPQQMSMSMIAQPNNSITQPIDYQYVEKRQRALLLQKELQQQMEMKLRAKEEEKLKEKRDKELDDFRVQKEREEMERRLLEEMASTKLEARNLQETNIESDKAKTAQRLQYLKYQNELLDQQQQKLANQSKRPRRPRTPLEEAESGMKAEQDYNTRMRIEQKIIKELPIEVEKTVKDTINVELTRLRSEMNLQTNQVAEQLISLKGQLLLANEQKHQNEEQLRRLRDELKQTQIVDEIRQRELYQAFLGQQKNQIIIDSTERLMSPDTVKFTFPNRPRPYYNMSDPYLGSNDQMNKDLHEIIKDSSQLMPMYTYKDTNKYDKSNVEEKMLYNANEIKEDTRLGYKIGEHMVDIPDDYLNRQRLYVPKKYFETKTNVNVDEDVLDGYQSEFQRNRDKDRQAKDIIDIIGNTNQQYVLEEDEVKDVLKHYDEKLERLDNIDASKSNINTMDQRDDALFDLIQQQNHKIVRKEPYKAQFEYNDYYFPDYHDTNFDNKLAHLYK